MEQNKENQSGANKLRTERKPFDKNQKPKYNTTISKNKGTKYKYNNKRRSAEQQMQSDNGKKNPGGGRACDFFFVLEVFQSMKDQPIAVNLGYFQKEDPFHKGDPVYTPYTHLAKRFDRYDLAEKFISHIHLEFERFLQNNPPDHSAEIHILIKKVYFFTYSQVTK